MRQTLAGNVVCSGTVLGEGLQGSRRNFIGAEKVCNSHVWLSLEGVAGYIRLRLAQTGALFGDGFYICSPGGREVLFLGEIGGFAAGWSCMCYPAHNSETLVAWED